MMNIIETYGEDLTKRNYVTNPAIKREDEIRKLMMVLLTPDKSGLLVGKAGIGKTAIVEGLAYLIQKDQVPEALKGYRVVKVSSTNLLGKVNIDGKEELVISLLVNELKQIGKIVIFIDEVHTLIGGRNDGPLDIANILKPALDRGDVKAIGATTTEEYQTYIIRDRAFLRRFEKIEVEEPSEETTSEILYQSLPRIEAQTNIKFKYNEYVTKMLIDSIVSATSEYKRVYGLAAMYPDVAFSVLSAAFSQALYQNKPYVDITDVYNAIKESKRIYPDSIVKELDAFREKYKDFCLEEGITLPVVTIDEVNNHEEDF